MRGSRLDRALRLLAVFLLCGPAGCSSTGAPRGWLAPAKNAPLDPFGAWIRIEPKGRDRGRVSGEFIGVSADSVYVLGGFGLQSIGRADVKRAKIAFFDPQTGGPGGWVGMGTFSTLSHGLWLVLSAPVWLLAGSLTAGGHSRKPLEHYPRDDWESLRLYARFPQGLPEGLRDMDLKEKMKVDWPAPDDPEGLSRSPD